MPGVLAPVLGSTIGNLAGVADNPAVITACTPFKLPTATTLSDVLA